MNLQDYHRITLIQTAFPGDVALALYTAQTIKNVHPSCRLSFVTTPVSAPLLECIPAIDRIIVYDKRGKERGVRGIWNMAKFLRGEDCILSAHRSLRTSLLVRLAAPALSVGYSTSVASWFYRKRVQYPAALQEAERVLHLLSPFSDIPVEYYTQAPKPEILITPDLRDSAQHLLLESGCPPEQPTVFIAPGSVWATKRWKEEHIITLIPVIQAKGYAVILVGSRDDIPLCKTIASQTGALSLAGKTTLPQLLALLQGARVLLCNDSAPLHCANLVNCPVVAVFGPTIPAFGFAPRNNHDSIIELEGLSCRPCSPHGTQHCPIGTHECMSGITPEVVEKFLRKYL